MRRLDLKELDGLLRDLDEVLAAAQEEQEAEIAYLSHVHTFYGHDQPLAGKLSVRTIREIYNSYKLIPDGG